MEACKSCRMPALLHVEECKECKEALDYGKVLDERDKFNERMKPIVRCAKEKECEKMEENG